MQRLLWTVGLAMLVASCAFPGGPTGSPVVDSWPVGTERICAAGNARCMALIPAAISGFDRRDPGHAAILRATLHDEGAVFDAAGNRMLMTRSGSCCSVVVFELADGSVRAIGVGYPGVSQVPIAVEQGP